MKAGLLIIGDELLAGSSQDRHSPWLIGELSMHGVIVYETRLVGDHEDQISTAISQLAAMSDLVIVTGGLGPTADDLTRQALAAAGGGPLKEDKEALASLQEWFSDRGTEMPDSNRSQAMRPDGMKCVRNTCGTAPGLLGEINGAQVLALPGPPIEMQTMFNDVRDVILRGDADALVNISGGVFAFGMPEALAGERLGSLMDRGQMPSVGLTARNGILHAVARAQGSADVASKMVQTCVERIKQAWSPWAFSCEDRSLSKVVGELLDEKKLTISTAESCTGGWIGKSLVDVAGSSAWYVGGWVVYRNEMKCTQLGVDPTLMQDGGPGAVSQEVAIGLAKGACQLAGSDLSLSVTGIAGPTGGSTSKPVGTVFIGLCDRRSDPEHVAVRQFCFSGHRSQVRERTVNAALQICRLYLLGIEPAEPLLWEVPGHSL